MEAIHNVSTGFIKAFQSYDPFMLAIAVLFFVVLALAFERFMFLSFILNVNSHAFIRELQKYITGNEIDRAITFCRSRKMAALPMVLERALLVKSRTEAELQEAVDEASLGIVPKIQSILPYLALFANISTLMGLLGTVCGLINSFVAVGQADPEQKQTLLSQGISLAMNTTAFGLIVAIMTMIAHSYLQEKANRIIDDMDYYSTKIVNMLKIRG